MEFYRFSWFDLRFHRWSGVAMELFPRGYPLIVPWDIPELAPGSFGALANRCRAFSVWRFYLGNSDPGRLGHHDRPAGSPPCPPQGGYRNIML